MKKYHFLGVIVALFVISSVVYRRPIGESTVVLVTQGSNNNVTEKWTIRTETQRSSEHRHGVQNGAKQAGDIHNGAVLKSPSHRNRSTFRDNHLQQRLVIQKPHSDHVDNPSQTIDAQRIHGQYAYDKRKLGETPLCSNEQRLRTIEHYCQEHQVAERFMYKFRRQKKLLELQQQRRRGRADGSSSAAANTQQQQQQPSDWLDELPDEEILRISQDLWIDPANSVVVCLHSKAGTTTWKAILGNNSMGTEFQVTREQDVHSKAATRGLRTADSGGSIEEIKYRLRNWYKIIVTRHPFDRLVSSFNDKVLSEDPTVPSAEFSKRLRKVIRERYHAHAAATSFSGNETIQFKDFIQLILDGYKNDHWNGPYEEKCHACLLNYEYIVKLESETRDARYIIEEKLQGRGLNTHFNQRRSELQSSVLSGRDLSAYFHALSPHQYELLQQKYASDFHMYGYHMERAPSFSANCSQRTEDGGTCC